MKSSLSMSLVSCGGAYSYYYWSKSDLSYDGNDDRDVK